MPFEIIAIDSADVLSIVLVFVALIAADWVLFDSARRSIAAFREVPPPLTYRSFLFPRLIIVAISAIMIALARAAKDDVVATVGICTFGIATLYRQIVMFVKSRKY